jgi:hypothetical protein
MCCRDDAVALERLMQVCAAAVQAATLTESVLRLPPLTGSLTKALTHHQALNLCAERVAALCSVEALRMVFPVGCKVCRRAPMHGTLYSAAAHRTSACCSLRLHAPRSLLMHKPCCAAMPARMHLPLSNTVACG